MALGCAACSDESARDAMSADALSTAPDGGLLLPDATLLLPDGGVGVAAVEGTVQTSHAQLTVAEFRGEVSSDGALVITKLDPALSSDPQLRRMSQGLCAINLVQDSVAGSGPADSIELVSNSIATNAGCAGYTGSPLSCANVTIRSFFTAPIGSLVVQVTQLVPATGYTVQNGDSVVGTPTGIGLWDYGAFTAAGGARDSWSRDWVFATSGGQFTFTGRVLRDVVESCNGVDDDCDGVVDEGNSCITLGGSCVVDGDCASGLACNSGLCGPGCGNGRIDGTEGCDDSNTATEACDYGLLSCTVCDSSCASVAGVATYCGDGQLQASEVCDEGSDNGTGLCSEDCGCGAGYHLEGGVCLSDTRGCTLDFATSASQVWDASTSRYGVCTAGACEAAYHLEAGACVSDTRGCPLDFATSASQLWDGLTSSYGLCTASACEAAYHLEAGACVSDTRSCTLDFATSASQLWDASTLSYGLCTAIGCEAAYHLEAGACVSDTRGCTLDFATAASQLWDGLTSSYGVCTATACESGYSVEGGVCVGSLGAACTANAECASGFCATGPDGTANDRCAPEAMNYIPAGTFIMGSALTEVGRDGDETQHSVTLSRSFFMGQTEVTQGQWKALSGGTNPSYFQSTTGTGSSTINANDSGPVEQTDWYAAVAFANARSAAEGLTSCYALAGCTDPGDGWKDGTHSGCTGATFSGITCTGYRLPTESEWEYAARAGTTTATYLGNLTGVVDGCTTTQANLDGIAWWCGNSGSRTNAVGGKTSNAFGLSDMLGNVWEWTGDWYGTYPGTVTDPLGAGTGSAPVYRGGSWYNSARIARAAFRNLDTPDNRYGTLGFRLVRTVTRGCDTLPPNAVAGVEAANASGWRGCEATACATSYHVESGLCVSDTRACTLPNATEAGETWNSGTGSYGSCTATACESGYSVEGGACIGSLGAACTANAECASGFCATGPDGTANDRCAPEAMNYIPAGTFIMGSALTEVGRDGDETQHSVTLSRSFFMGQTEVTQGQWKALSGGTNPSYFQSTTGTGSSTINANDSGPVEQTDWYAAVAFANARSAAEGLTSCYALAGCTDPVDGWKDGTHSGCTGATFSGITCTGYRLPTESEWEYAARAGTTTATYLGNLSGTVTDCTTAQANLDGIAWWCGNSGGRTQAVGGNAANSWGLRDMLGNVWEWMGDWYGTYPGTVTDPLGASTGSDRVLRGGSWFTYALLGRAAYRSSVTPAIRSGTLGFRLSRTAP